MKFPGNSAARKHPLYFCSVEVQHHWRKIKSNLFVQISWNLLLFWSECAVCCVLFVSNEKKLNFLCKTKKKKRHCPFINVINERKSFNYCIQNKRRTRRMTLHFIFDTLWNKNCTIAPGMCSWKGEFTKW